jgi:isocitrate/isopropylmalate dehydrogenase
VALVRTDISEEHIASIIRVARIIELGTKLAATRNRDTLRIIDTANVVLSSPIHATLLMEAIRFFKTSVLTRATQRNIPDDSILKELLDF